MKKSGIIKKSLRNYKVARHRPKVWILPSSKIGYVKITKVASSSVELALSKYIYQASTGENMLDMDKEIIRTYADQYAIHTDLKDLPADRRPEFLFSFVRNPLARLHSSYVNKIEDVRTAGEDQSIFWNHGITLDMSFEAFIERLIEIPDPKIDRHLRSQASVLCDKGNVLVDYVGRFENMAEDWKIIAEQYKLPLLPHKNKSSKSETSSPQSPYTHQTAKIVADRYREDIETFGYADEVQHLLDSLQ
ncbi:MAG: sulfotransferase family protein [Porticoccaceae bacterium]|nr:sulfotransferase family protein [Porticoccaceae bacterium]